MSSAMDFDSEDARKGAFWRAITARPGEEDCEDCRHKLGDYIAAQLAGENYLTQFPTITTHLDICSDCAAIYAHLYELEAAALADALPTAAPQRRPDLSFLGEDSLVSLLRDLLQRSGDRLQLQLSAALLSFMRPAPALAVTRSGAGELLYQLDVMAADLPDMPLTLAIYADAARLETCLVEVTVVPAEKSWPDLGGREIILHVDNKMYKKTTDSWGVVTFPGIPLDKLKDLLFVVGVN